MAKKIDYQAYINDDQPFGPINATHLIDDQPVFDLLFDDHNEVYKKLRRRPSLIIGRRGSGKTSYLHSTTLEEGYDYVIVVDNVDTYSQIIRAVEGLGSSEVFAENLGRLWEAVLWVALFSYLVNTKKVRDDGFNKVRNYISALGVQEVHSVEDAIWAVTNTIADSHGSVASLIANTLKNAGGTSLRSCQTVVRRWLDMNNKRAVIVMDSIEQLELNVQTITHAVKGMLNCVGGFNKPNSSFDVRFALPAELYHQFHDISSAPLKDFESAQTLHWHAKELLLIAAKRAQLYLDAQGDPRFSDAKRLKITDISGALSLFRMILPDQITNKKGVEEFSIAYILRHTQLLPRHLLMFLNSIALESASSGEPIFPIDEKSIINGITEKEGELCSEVFSAFRSIYPYGRAVCEALLPELPPTFNDGTLHTLFTQNAKKSFMHGDYSDAKRMLVEIGVLGRVYAKRNRYLIATFEYTAPHKMSLSENDTLCVHPVFAGTFGNSTAGDVSVYPFGSDVHADDYRRHR